jgi:uncharacterized membrane-anchored protein
LLFLGLLATLILWYKKFKNLEVYPITDRTKEVFYGVAIMFTKSLSTAFGNYLSEVVRLSYLIGAMVTAGIIYAMNKKRPYNNGDRSFPSGHTSTTFQSAA